MARRNVFLSALLMLLMINSSRADEECQEKLSNANNLMIELLKASPPSSENKAEHEAIMGCLFKNRGILDQNGELIEDNFLHAIIKELRQKYPAEVAEKRAGEALEYCRKAKGASVGQTSLEVIKCLGIWKNQAFIEKEAVKE
ncbi:hypothetical protein PPYR_01583 [Photinus pyralis]|uniref:Uncharacterized protein n=1 Tax=Photinus pyralis TaxID=7054 RepID=A0A1Y1MPP2_PHOPY|nr:uncharacterized protein LOC116159099 [Photinus pyralis]XP_031327865.1 uncharacterized protein LOC116159101 [Photinus pyralis]KAB0804611.1 hypothetical protein PPYR_01581 [Photinus pyralis]KAB0804613.1 hypothetical protein PPYR_01583 [Photinus pyralis]